MNATRIETTIEIDGELHLTSLPVRKGDRIEATVVRLDESALKSQANTTDEREAARREFLELAKSSTFRSTAAYPTRDELHERT